jgi:rhamnosyltransferase
MTKRVGIVIRAKNEERWIAKTLQSLKTQTYQNFQVVLVDNNSTDNTVNIFKALMPEGIVVTIDKYMPGKAINVGITACDTELVSILSAHCIPVTNTWLESFINIMKDEKVGAAYGRQIPLPSSHPLDKRDLLNTFGIERRIQKKDTFFHNANSIIRRKVWEKHPYDEDVKHIEDRIWAESIVSEGEFIGYEPDGSVYHYHGIYHHHDYDRAAVISQILAEYTLPDEYDPSGILAPERNETLYCILGCDNSKKGKLLELIGYIKSDCPNGTIVISTNEPIDMHSGEHNVLVDDTFYSSESTFVEILNALLSQAADHKIYPDCVVYLNLKIADYSKHDLGKIVNTFYAGSFDSVFYAESEYSNIWAKSEDVYHPVRTDYTPRSLKDPIYLARYGLGLATRPEFIRKKELVGSNVAIVEVTEK